MPVAKITLNHQEVQAAVASFLNGATGMKFLPEEVAFFHEGDDNHHGAPEIEVFVSATAR